MRGLEPYISNSCMECFAHKLKCECCICHIVALATSKRLREEEIFKTKRSHNPGDYIILTKTKELKNRDLVGTQML